MISAYRRGLRRAAARWPLVLALWLLGLLFGAGFALACGVWLAAALDASLATRTLAKELDPNILIDLYFHHREGLLQLLPLAACMGLVSLALWVWLHGAVVVAVQRREAGVGEAFRRGFETSAVYARLLAAALLVLAAFSAAVGGATWAARRWSADSPSALLGDALLGGGVAVWLVGYVLFTAIHDHARLRAATSGEGALAAYGWAWRLVWRGGERAFLLALLLQLSAALLWAGGQLVSWTLPGGAHWSVAASLLWGEALLLLRVWVRVWFFAAQNELH
jgi:hypothetical protein